MASKIAFGQPMTLHFKLTSHKPSEVHVLKWRTPLEGMLGHDFKITRDGAEVKYTGPMVKRGAPNAKSYAPVAPGQALEADIDLALAYDFTKPGAYHVAFTGGLLDVQSNKADVPRPLDGFSPVAITCAPIDVEVTSR